ncbi:MAG: hypothetical protein JXR34_06935, partial [Bacteroidales bacterium]|nr:hypothetical protein [Bacteroidales bacterium]
MQTYINQLVKEIRGACGEVKPPHQIWFDSGADPDDEVELEDITFVEQYVYGEPKPISEITGIAFEKLPASDLLSKNQQALLALELSNLLAFHHFHLDFPVNYPLDLQYPIIRKIWSQSHVEVSFGTVHIDLCDFEIANCPFPHYCNICEENERQMEIDNHGVQEDQAVDFEVRDLLPKPEDFEEIDELHEDANVPFEMAFGEMAIFDDDGNRVNMEMIPVPGLCVICKKYQTDDEEEDLLCQLNRFDQQSDDEFICDAFEPM